MTASYYSIMIGSIIIWMRSKIIITGTFCGICKSTGKVNQRHDTNIFLDRCFLFFYSRTSFYTVCICPDQEILEKTVQMWSILSPTFCQPCRWSQISGGHNSGWHAFPQIWPAMCTAFLNCTIAAPGEGGSERKEVTFWLVNPSNLPCSRPFEGSLTPYTDKVNCVTLWMSSAWTEAGSWTIFWNIAIISGCFTKASNHLAFPILKN